VAGSSAGRPTGAGSCFGQMMMNNISPMWFPPLTCKVK
jgi:hypothetical protein